MKKITAVLTVLVLLCTLLTVGVSAGGFTFREVAREQSGASLLVTWNNSEATADTTIEDVIIGGVSCNFTMEADNRLRVDTSAVPAGIHTVQYRYVSGTQQGTTVSTQKISVSGVATVQLDAVINADGTVTVTAKSNGSPVAGYNLLLTIGNMAGMTGVTGANGTYTSYVTLDNGQTVLYEGVSTTIGAVTYASAAQKSLQRVVATTATTPPATTAGTTETTATETTAATDTTTADSGAETTTADTAPTTMVPSSTVGGETGVDTEKTVLGAGTTAVKGDKVILNVSTDSGILSLFGCTADRFADRARVTVSADDYTSLVGRNSANRLMLNVLTDTSPVSETLVSAALQGSSDFADYAEDEHTFLSFDLSFLVMNKEGEVVPVSALPLGSVYEVELPVPDSMKDCDELAITMMDGGALMTPQKVNVKGGAFKLQINSLEAYTLIGLTSANSAKAGGVSLWVVLLLIVGILLLAGAGALLYFFVFRKSNAAQAKETKTAEAEAPSDAPVIAVAPEEDTDIFSGRTDMPPSDGE